jgi:hypothetical protein
MCWSCAHDLQIEKHQNKRDNIINVQEKIKEIKISEDDVLIGAVARLFLIDSILIIADSRSSDKLIHIFNKNTFRYITSTANRGQGPGEIVVIGHIGIDESNRTFFASDHGKQEMFSYNLDSVLVNPKYIPATKMKMDKHIFPNRYEYINDTLSIGEIIYPVGVGNFNQSVGKWNMKTGEVIPMNYTHPDVEEKRTTFAASIDKNIYVECYSRRDLMSICSFNGDLKYNIYGPNWSKRPDNRHHYDKVIFCKDKILAAYSGGSYMSDEYYPTRFFVFNIDGDYLQTIEIEYRISDYCYDEENNRVILILNEAIQFAYLELDDLLINI